MTIRAVFFDMGGTIERYWYTPELRLKAIPGLKQRLLSAGIDLGFSDKELLKAISTGYGSYHKWSIDSMEELPPQRVWGEFIFAGTTIDQQKLAVVAEELMFTLESRFYRRELRLEVPSVLEAIQEMGLKIGLISNVCCRNLVPANLEQYGIRDYFDPIILSSEYGRRKPDPAIFHYAARMANVPTGECVYIGDRIARDIVGARKAGYRLAVQIRHDFEHGEDDSGATPDAIVDRMTEFLEILQAELLNSTHPRVEKDGPNPIRALLFDAGDILYYRKNTGNKLAVFLSEIGLSYKEFPFDKRTVLRDQAYQGLIDYDQYQETILKFYGITRLDEIARGKQILDEDVNNVQFFEGVPETLGSLKDEGYLLGIITDTALPVHVKLNWFERGGFGDVWDSIISSKELGVRKPNPKIYKTALQQLGVSADQAVFIGHKISELNGAKTVGLKTIAFNYEDGAVADFHISHFSDLLNVPFLRKSDSIKP
jgi:putative hydrolase of the HAD superfamily